MMSTSISSLPMPDRSSVSVPICRVLAETAIEVDNLAVKEPWEIRVSYVLGGRRKQKAISITMTTVRSHDQFNTTIYGLHGRYRGLHYERRFIMMNREDMVERGFRARQKVEITSHFEGETRTLRDYIVIEYPITRQSTAMYYPEASVLVPSNSTEPFNNCPTFKSSVIAVTAADRPAAAK